MSLSRRLAARVYDPQPQVPVNALTVHVEFSSLRLPDLPGVGHPPQEKLLDLLDVDFLSVPAVIGEARDMALSVTDECDASEIALGEEAFRTQGQVLMHILPGL